MSELRHNRIFLIWESPLQNVPYPGLLLPASSEGHGIVSDEHW